MHDSEFFAKHRCKYRVRPPNTGECPGSDPQQAVLVAQVAPGAHIRFPLPSDIDQYQNASQSDLEALARTTPYAADRNKKQWLSMDQVRSRFEKRLKSKARKEAMK